MGFFLKLDAAQAQRGGQRLRVRAGERAERDPHLVCTLLQGRIRDPAVAGCAKATAQTDAKGVRSVDGRNPDVIALASLLHRTPGALAMKCGNIASLDPALRARGVAGLGNASAMDRKIWAEFHASWDTLALECERMLATLRADAHVEAPVQDVDTDIIPAEFTGHTRLAMVELRVKQHFFRRAVLSGYRHCCCISGVSDARLLVASHIVPWRDDASIRLHPGNGLCLSAIHDKAFDHYLFSLSDDHRILLSPALEQTRKVFIRYFCKATRTGALDL